MSHEPRPGEVSSLPGTTFLTCPACGATSVVTAPPSFPITYTCTGCQERWVVDYVPVVNGFTWSPKKKEA